VKQNRYTANAWTAVVSFGGLSAVEAELFQRVNGTNAHRLYNVLTLDGMMHFLFINMELWFEATVCVSSAPS
jgi:hypothetical protein